MANEYVLDEMLKKLDERRNKLAYTIVKCYEEGYHINSRKANLFYIANIVSDCYAIRPQLSTVQQNKLLNITRKILSF